MDPPLTLAGVERVAVLRANALGDFVFSLPALDALDAAYPDAEIILLGRRWHADFLADRRGPIDRVVLVPGDSHPDALPGSRFADAPWLAASPAERTEFASAMLAQHLDLAIQIHGGGRNSNPFVLELGARRTIGLRTPDAVDLDAWVPYVYHQQEIARTLEVVALVGAGPVTIDPRVAITERDRDEAKDLIGAGGPTAVIHPGAVDPRRRWPASSFAAVADALDAHGLRVVLTGTSSEVDLVEEVTGAMHVRAISLVGRSSLGGLAAIMASASVVVANDTGPLHLAAAVGAPTVGIYWCGNLINGGPLSRRRHRPLVSWRLTCPTCGVDCTRARCPHDPSFVADVPVEEVVEAAISLIGARDEAAGRAA